MPKQMNMYEYYNQMQLLCCRCNTYWKVIGDYEQAAYYSTAEDEIIRREKKLTFMAGISYQDSKKVRQLEAFAEETKALKNFAIRVLEEVA